MCEGKCVRGFVARVCGSVWVDACLKIKRITHKAADSRNKVHIHVQCTYVHNNFM